MDDKEAKWLSTRLAQRELGLRYCIRSLPADMLVAVLEEELAARSDIDLVLQNRGELE